MSRIVIAKVLTASLKDKYHRVKLSAEGLWKESELVPSVGAKDLNPGDEVYVDVSSGLMFPIILGRVRNSNFDTDAQISGTKVFESHNDTGWSSETVDGDSVVMENDKGARVEFDGPDILLNGDNYHGVVYEFLSLFLDELLQELARITVSGKMIDNMPQIMQFRTRLEEFKSEHVLMDD